MVNVIGMIGDKRKMHHKNQPKSDPWSPVWADDQLMAAIPLQQLNPQGIPNIDELNQVLTWAFEGDYYPYLYPVWTADEEDTSFDGIAIAEEEWVVEGYDSQRQWFYDQIAQDDQPWVVDWRDGVVFAFPFERINSCFYLLYQRELDEAIGRRFHIQLHVVRHDDTHDERNPAGLLLTTTLDPGLTPEVIRALYNQLIEEKDYQ